MFNVCGHEFVIPDQRARAGEQLLRFLLVPVESGIDVGIQAEAIGLEAIRARLADQSLPSVAVPSLSVVQYRRRSWLVKQYALLRAASKCEACGNPPPFLDDDGKGFLEVHHISRLADEGIDGPGNVVAVCPNCHRRAHHSADRLSFQAALAATVAVIEAKFSASH
jgi:5-methylcytosine-specific restriction protein A